MEHNQTPSESMLRIDAAFANVRNSVDELYKIRRRREFRKQIVKSIKIGAIAGLVCLIIDEHNKVA